MKNKINAQMDHVWDGFYTGQVRLSRFPAIVDAVPKSIYDITYTGTPPKKQLFKLIADSEKAGMTVRIAYASA